MIVELHAAGLADPECAVCGGAGTRQMAKRLNGRMRPVCECVWRKLGRICIARRREAQATGDEASLMERSDGGHILRGFRNAEYCADLDQAAARALDADELRIYREYLVGGRTAAEMASRLGWEKGRFFARVYRAEAKLGQACAGELLPREYFARTALAIRYDRGHGAGMNSGEAKAKGMVAA